ncbi:MAG: hypothetical protein OEZ38_05260 [Gammaproteobacteria bacterium]|nr:hypothetical protein [Gammaproteobacteria bacterium]
MQICLRLLILPVLFLLLSCSQKTLSIFFDLPATPPDKITQAQQPTDQQAISQTETATIKEEEVTPLVVTEIENARSWKEAEKMLPINKLGQRDWAMALQQSIIQPRSAIGGTREPGFIFKFDFYLKGPDPVFDAFFPHSVHTQHLDCASCHPKLFRYRGTKITMDDINKGQYCGFCHGSVSFSPGPENCARCHTALAGG